MKNKEPKVTTFTERNTMLNLMPVLARTVILCAVPKIIDITYDTFFNTKKPEPKIEPPEVKAEPAILQKVVKEMPAPASTIPPDIKQKLGISDKTDTPTTRVRLPGSRVRTKKADTTKFTRFHYDHIVYRRRQTLQYNDSRRMNERIAVPQLHKLLNHEFDVDKAATSYSNIYCGIVSRDDLPKATGEELVNPMASGGENDAALRALYDQVDKL